MRARIVRIGNSHGIRIPKPILEATGLRDEVELEVDDGRLIVRQARRPRQGWVAGFRRAAASRDERRFDPESSEDSNWDKEEWEW